MSTPVVTAWKLFPSAAWVPEARLCGLLECDGRGVPSVSGPTLLPARAPGFSWRTSPLTLYTCPCLSQDPGRWRGLVKCIRRTSEQIWSCLCFLGCQCANPGWQPWQWEPGLCLRDVSLGLGGTISRDSNPGKRAQGSKWTRRPATEPVCSSPRVTLGTVPVLCDGRILELD